MKKAIPYLLFAITLLVVYFAPVGSAHALQIANPHMIADTAKNEVCAGIGLTSGGGCGDSGAQVTKALSAAVSLLSVIAGLVAVVMVIIAGLKFVTSGGDTNKVASAKSSIIYAIIGLVVVALSQMLVHFVFNQVK